MHEKDGCALTHQHTLLFAPFMLMAGGARGRFRDQSLQLELTGVCGIEVDSFKTLGSRLLAQDPTKSVGSETQP